MNLDLSNWLTGQTVTSMLNDMTQEDGLNDRDDAPWREDWAISAIVSDMTRMADSQADRDAGSVSDLAGLLVAVRAKNRDAFESLYDATVQRVFSLALRITRRQELAEDVVSDVYLQVWQRADSYSPDRGKVIAWLCVLCRSRALDALRRDNTAIRQVTVGLDTVKEPEDPNEPPDILQSVEQGSAIHAALGKLSEQQRQLVALAYFRGYTHSELAAFMNMPIGTVKTHLRRAMISLRRLISDGTGINGESDE